MVQSLELGSDTSFKKDFNFNKGVINNPFFCSKLKLCSKATLKLA